VSGDVFLNFQKIMVFVKILRYMFRDRVC